MGHRNNYDNRLLSKYLEPLTSGRHSVYKKHHVPQTPFPNAMICSSLLIPTDMGKYSRYKKRLNHEVWIASLTTSWTHHFLSNGKSKFCSPLKRLVCLKIVSTYATSAVTEVDDIISLRAFKKVDSLITSVKIKK